MRINSPNHGGNGQNVLYQDGHADWCNSPCCGINDDNIYTVATGVATTLPDGNPDLTPRVIGAIPTATSVPYDQDDSVIVNISWGTLTEVYTK
jgi:prepilin-type processing-associated H-X9-DG protein